MKVFCLPPLVICFFFAAPAAVSRIADLCHVYLPGVVAVLFRNDQPSVFSRMFSSLLEREQRDKLNRVLEIQSKLLSLLEDHQSDVQSNEVANIDIAQTVKIKKDLDAIFAQVRSITDKIRIKYPDAYTKALLQVPLPPSMQD